MTENERKVVVLIDSLARRCSNLESVVQDIAHQLRNIQAVLEAHQKAIETLASTSGGTPTSNSAAPGAN